MTVRIVVHPHEPISLALRRLRPQLWRNGVTWEMLWRTAFIDPAQIHRRNSSRSGSRLGRLPSWHSRRASSPSRPLRRGCSRGEGDSRLVTSAAEGGVSDLRALRTSPWARMSIRPKRACARVSLGKEESDVRSIEETFPMPLSPPATWLRATPARSTSPAVTSSNGLPASLLKCARSEKRRIVCPLQTGILITKGTSFSCP
jgi:ribosomal protein S21